MKFKLLKTTALVTALGFSGSSVYASAENNDSDSNFIQSTLQLNTANNQGSNSKMLSAQSSGSNVENKAATQEIVFQKLPAKLQQEFAKRGGEKKSLMQSSQNSSNEIKVNGDVVYATGLRQNIENMPVLNQARTGTCVTFASTAGIDILNGGYDSLSIYDSLLEGDKLHLGMIDPSVDNTAIEKALNDTNEAEGLDMKAIPNPVFGSYGTIVIAQLATYGAMAEADADTQQGNFGVNPIVASEQIGSGDFEQNVLDEIDSREFSKLNFKYTTLDLSKPQNNANKIKKAIDQGKIAMIGIGLAPKVGNNGMTDKFYPEKVSPDAPANVWSETNVSPTGGHEVLVVGYYKTDNGPLFMIRNSWGKDNGYKGNNFMTVDYINSFMSEANILESSDNLEAS